jgi:hypothetical protein
MDSNEKNYFPVWRILRRTNQKAKKLITGIYEENDNSETEADIFTETEVRKSIKDYLILFYLSLVKSVN